MHNVLIIDDDVTFSLMLSTFLTKKGFGADTAYSFTEGFKAIKSGKYQVALLDVRLPDRNGMEMLREISTLPKKCQVIVMTGYGDIPTAVKAIKMGAFEYVTKPVNPDEVLHLVQQSVAEGEKEPAKQSQSEINFVNGVSEESQKMNEHISLVAPTDMSVLIFGDSGTGKEFVARRIHLESSRADKPFVAMDCGALPKDLALSEFFGHVKGAFTGAISDKTGHFLEANGGTLFLDEIGNLTYEVQVQLLRAIQERKIKPVGSTKVFNIDVRIIAATNNDVLKSINDGEFREDLYHRLNEFSIQVPRLSERNGDLMIFADYFLQQANTELKRKVGKFDREVVEVFKTYSWPGNIRELKNVIKRAVLLSKGDVVTKDTLPREIIQDKNKTENIARLTDNLKDLKDKIEYQQIVQVLEKVRYNKSKAAQMLNIDRKTLYNKLKQYNIET